MLSASLTSFYRLHESRVVEAGFEFEATSIKSRAAGEYEESFLLREAAWVVLCSGFSEEVVRHKFDFISLCFFDWESASLIVGSSSACLASAADCFSNRRKLEAIVEIARMIHNEGFCSLKARIANLPIDTLREMPMIGPITAQHLAKNLGFKMAKDDRHLARLASYLGFRDANDLCGAIATETGEEVDVIDTVLWRSCALEHRYRRRGTISSDCDVQVALS